LRAIVGVDGYTTASRGEESRDFGIVNSLIKSIFYNFIAPSKTSRQMVLYIKNMVCHRCKMVVGTELEKLKLHPINIALGEVLIEEKQLSKEQLQQVGDSLTAVGFELIDDRKSKLIEQIKTFVIDAVHYKNEQPKKNYSELLSQHLHHDYSHLSNLFSAVEGITIEQYIINQKIEKVKELLMYGELSLSQIALQLGYSSTAHLSNQFKKLTGLTPSKFKQMGIESRKSLDDVGKPE
jgi:AraC-like DNA-binding protein